MNSFVSKVAFKVNQIR